MNIPFAFSSWHSHSSPTPRGMRDGHVGTGNTPDAGPEDVRLKTAAEALRRRKHHESRHRQHRCLKPSKTDLNDRTHWRPPPDPPLAERAQPPNPEMTLSIAAHGPSAANPAPARSGGLRARYFAEDAAAATPYQRALLREAAVPSKLDTPSGWRPPRRARTSSGYSSYETPPRRVAALKASRFGRPDALPEGYPQRVDKPWVWSGDEIAAERYVVRLDEQDVEQIEEALGFLKVLHDNVVGVAQGSLAIDLAKAFKLGPESVMSRDFPRCQSCAPGSKPSQTIFIMALDSRCCEALIRQSMLRSTMCCCILVNKLHR